MRVIAGTLKGRRLEAPKGEQVRPTLDRVRESLFNILAPRIVGVNFLDLYAGSGANGIEALSRGAARCTFVDNGALALRALGNNLDNTGLAAKARVRRLSLPEGLARLAEAQERYDLVFADPPYGLDVHERLLTSIKELGLLADQGLIVLEHATSMALPESVGPCERVRQARYGHTTLSLYT
ncbi:MAG: 16S rRNA (guanine(966)-N(2))-methyltransferase RsmD [FCB group bacterium]|nr:16S rRNA (guanine(966)-N(2))-methyltransferase RsmD [FCB group bacterium]